MSAQEMPPTSITLPPNTHFESAVDLDEVQTKDPTHVLQSSTPVELSHLTSHPQPRRDSFTTASSNLPASATPRLQDEESFATNPIPPVVAGQQEPAASGMASTIKPAAARDDTAQSGAVTTSNSDAVSTPAEASRATPVVLITLLLTTGVRQTYDIDAKYLQDHKVAGSNAETDPFTISAYTLKELIWKAWQEVWEPRPSSPSAIRLIHFGRLLDDKSTMTECRFSPSTRNVIHMSVKPQDVVDDEVNAKAGKSSHSRDRDENGSVGCRCIIL